MYICIYISNIFKKMYLPKKITKIIFTSFVFKLNEVIEVIRNKIHGK